MHDHRDADRSVAVEPRVRRRLAWTLFTTATLTSTGYIAAGTVAPLVADEVLDLGPLLGVPAALAISGSAVGASALAPLMARSRRLGLLVGFVTSIVGGLVAVAGTVEADPWLFGAGMAALGFGNAAGHQVRYAASDMYPEGRRGSVIGTIVWASTIGAVAGPVLVTPAGAIAVAAGAPEVVGGIAVGAAGFALAWLFVAGALRPDPAELAERDPVVTDPVPVAPEVGAVGPGEAGLAAPPPTAREASARPSHVRVALIAMGTGHAVMVLLMSVTAIRLRHGGHGLGAVSVALSLHVLGMYGLTPLFGRWSDRVGPLPVLLAGLGTVAASALLAAVAPAHDAALLTAAMFLLGLGWSAGFVAGSGLLATGVATSARARLQGRADTLVFTAAGAASLSAGALLDRVGYPTLSLIGTALALLAGHQVWRRRRELPHRDPRRAGTAG